MHAKCVLLWATFGATLWTTSHSCAAMSHALAADARQMCAAMSHVWCNSREDNCAFFWAAFLLLIQLCSTQDRLENSLSIYIFGILNLTCYFPYDPGWVGQTCFCWRTIAPFFGLHSSSRQNSDMPKKNCVACWSQLRGVRLVRQRKVSCFECDGKEHEVGQTKKSCCLGLYFGLPQRFKKLVRKWLMCEEVDRRGCRL